MQRTVWPGCVVVDTPLPDQHLRFTQCVKQFTVQQFITQLVYDLASVVSFLWPGSDLLKRTIPGWANQSSV